MTAPARPTETAEIREALRDDLADTLRSLGAEYPYSDADTLIAGPLATLLAQRDAALAERDEAATALASFKRGARREIDCAITRIGEITAQAARSTTDLAAAGVRIAALEEALKLCLEELEWQTEQAKHCGDPNHECPMQDIHGPTDGHRMARDTARATLSNGVSNAQVR